MDDMLSAWLSTLIGDKASGYKGCAIIPLHGIVNGKCTCGNNECKSQGKHPYTKHGLKDASKDIAEIAKLFNYRSDLNIGIVTGSASGFFVLDVDPKNGGMASLDELMNTYGEFPPTVVVKTGSGGIHIWFDCPEGLKIGNRTGFMPGLDIRGENGYVCAPPSLHLSGERYDYTTTSSGSTAAAPQWLIEMIQAKKKEAIKPLSSDHSTGAQSEWDEDEVCRMLDAIDPDSIYQEWLEVGMALQSGGYKLSLWDSWSRLGEKYENGDCEKRWHGFNPNSGITMGTLVHRAQLNGWKAKPIEHRSSDVINIDPLIEKARSLIKKPELIKPQPRQHVSGAMGFDPMELPGLIGDTVRWITKYARRKQPELALINTLCFAGAVFGRRYKSPANTRTNLYMVGIADTGSGKDHSRKSIKDLAHAAGLDNKIGADAIRSDAGMLRGLMNNTSQIMMIDEFGKFLQAISNDKAPHYVRAQVDILLKLYSSSNSTYNHGDYADTKLLPIIINSPNLCIYGTSTEEQYARSLKKSAIESGEVNRFVAIKSRVSREYPDRDMPLYEVDESLRNKWMEFSAKFGDSLGAIMNTSNIGPDPILIPWGECDDIQYKIECRNIDKSAENTPLRHLWGRLYENTVKIAMIFAIARDKDSPKFIQSDFDIAQLIVESSIEYLSNLADTNMSETPVEEINNEILAAIKANDGKMSKWEIARKFRKIKTRERDDVLNSLIEQEAIEVEKVMDGKGRPTTYFKIAA